MEVILTAMAAIEKKEEDHARELDERHAHFREELESKHEELANKHDEVTKMQEKLDQMASHMYPSSNPQRAQN